MKAETARQAAVAQARKEAEKQVRLLGVVLVHLLTRFDEIAGSRGVGASRCGAVR